MNHTAPDVESIFCALHTGNPEDTRQAAILMRDAAHTAGNRAQAEMAWYFIGFTLILDNRFSDAIQVMLDATKDQALRFDTRGIPVSFQLVLGIAYLRLELFDIASDYFHAAETALDTVIDWRLRSSVYNGLGQVCFEMKEYDQGLAHFQKALQEGRARPDQSSLVRIKLNIAKVHICLRMFDQAIAELDEALGLARKNDDSYGIGMIMNHLAYLYQENGNPELAIEYFDRSLDALSSTHHRANFLDTSVSKAETLVKLNRFGEASALVDSARPLLEESELHRYAKRLHLVKGKCHGAMGQWESATQELHAYIDMDSSQAIVQGKLAYAGRQKDERQREALSLKIHMQDQERQLLRAKDSMIETLASLTDLRDSETGGHIRRTRRYVGLFCTEMVRRSLYGMTEDLGSLYASVSILHDIGKVAIPDAILRKPGPLDPAEQAIMREHPSTGVRLIRQASWEKIDAAYFNLAAEIIGAHHENWDGTGYPAGLAGLAIPLGGRIMAICDCYDAIRSQRPYKQAHPHQQAISFIDEQGGKRFDPCLVELFSDIAGLFQQVYEEYSDV